MGMISLDCDKNSYRIVREGIDGRGQDLSAGSQISIEQKEDFIKFLMLSSIEKIFIVHNKKGHLIC